MIENPRPAWWVIIVVAVLGIVGLVTLFWFVPDLVPDEGDTESLRAARTTGIATLRAAALAGGLGLAAVLTLMFNARTAHTAEQNLHLTRQAQDDARDEAERSAQVARENIELTRRAQDDARGEAKRQAQATQESLKLTRHAQVGERYSAAVELLSGGNTSRGSDGSTDDIARTTAELGGIYALEQLAREGRDYRAIVVEVLSAFVRGRAALQPDHKVGWRHHGPDHKRVAPHVSDPPKLDHSAPTLAALTVLGRITPPLPTATLETVRALGSLDGAARRPTIRAALHKTNLRGVDLTGGAERQPDFSGADFSSSDLTSIVLFRANLRRATFFHTDLTGAMLSGADLNGAGLDGAWVQNAFLRETDLSGVDLREVNGLHQEQVALAKGDASTLLPEGLQRPASWDSSAG